MAERTLDADGPWGACYDHIGGGFSRYCHRPEHWLVPHFEKMLYDNALLILAYTAGIRAATGKPRYARRRPAARPDYVLAGAHGRPEGGFFCGQDADSEGVEGKFYAFTPEEVWQVLGRGQAGEALCRCYGINAGRATLRERASPTCIGTGGLEAWAGGRTHSLRQAWPVTAGSRTRLHLDDKVLAVLERAGRSLALARARAGAGQAPATSGARRVGRAACLRTRT